MRGDRRQLQPSDVVHRARTALADHRHIQYCLDPGKNGGKDPYRSDCSSSWERRGKLVFTSDCVGFAAWCAGFDRFQPGFPLQGGWINTTAMVKAAERGLGWFDEISPWERAEGCLVVHPRRLPLHRWGHVGVYVGNNRVIHCHGPALRGPAISESDVREFTSKPGCLFVRFAPPRKVDSSS